MKVVSKDKKVYSSVPAAMKIAGTPYANCDWIVMDEIEAKQPENKQVDYAEIPATRFSCLPWVPDESKFATPGATCGSQQLMPSTPATPSMPSGFSECNGLTGQELVDCIQKTQG
jgi:hypothetical protein